MKINAEIEGADLTTGINFYGETNADEAVVERIKELSVVLEDVFWELGDLHDQTKGRSEFSANEINRELSKLRKGLFMVMAQPEDVDTLKGVLYEIE